MGRQGLPPCLFWREQGWQRAGAAGGLSSAACLPPPHGRAHLAPIPALRLGRAWPRCLQRAWARPSPRPLAPGMLLVAVQGGWAGHLGPWSCPALPAIS